MCGRFAQKLKAQQLKEYYHSINAVEVPGRYNTAPGHDALVIANAFLERFGTHRVMRMMRWGLVPSWSKDMKIGYRLINARAETIEEKPSYRACFLRRRCVIPVNGYFEWQSDTREPYYFLPRDCDGQTPLSLGGLWDIWPSPDGSELLSFTIITVDASAGVKPVHERMPLILERPEVELWLDEQASPQALRPLLRSYDAEKLDMWAVSKQVNNPVNDVADIMQPA